VADPVQQFRDEIRAAGLPPPDHIEADGGLHRFHVLGDKSGSRNGWYCLHLDGRPAGIFGSWKAGFSQTWAAGGARLNEVEREAFGELIRAAKAKAQAERRADHEAQAVGARAEWAAAGAPDPTHRYLLAKSVQCHNLRQLGVALIVPLIDVHGLLWNVQRIMPDGAKRFRPGRAGGLFSPVGDLMNPAKLLVCEGWATGATLHQVSGDPVLCAMNAGNLLKVATAARAAWPDAELVICADNDRYTAGNPGVTAATAAARATGAKLAVPEFPEGVPGSDFNDMANLRRAAA